jgi:hypothetical protein
MNRYGRMAQQHWARWLPQATATLTDPGRFFTMLGLQVADEIDSRASELAGDDPRGEDYLTRLGRLRNARFTAEETVLREWVLLPPEEPAEQEDSWPTGHLSPENEDDPATADRGGWMPTTVDPTHPAWAAELEYQQHPTSN